MDQKSMRTLSAALAQAGSNLQTALSSLSQENPTLFLTSVRDSISRSLSIIAESELEVNDDIAKAPISLPLRHARPEA